MIIFTLSMLMLVFSGVALAMSQNESKRSSLFSTSLNLPITSNHRNSLEDRKVKGESDEYDHDLTIQSIDQLNMLEPVDDQDSTLFLEKDKRGRKPKPNRTVQQLQSRQSSLDTYHRRKLREGLIALETRYRAARGKAKIELEEGQQSESKSIETESKYSEEGIEEDDNDVELQELIRSKENLARKKGRPTNREITEKALKHRKASLESYHRNKNKNKPKGEVKQYFSFRVDGDGTSVQEGAKEEGKVGKRKDYRKLNREEAQRAREFLASPQSLLEDVQKQERVRWAESILEKEAERKSRAKVSREKWVIGQRG